MTSASEIPSPEKKAHEHSRIGLYTYRYHRLYAIFDAVFQAVVFGPTLTFIVLKALAFPGMDDKLYAVMLSWFPTLISMSAPIWGTSSGNSRRYWLVAGLGARLIPTVLLAFATEPWQAVLLVTAMAFFGSGVPPMQNALYGRNYLPSERDKFHARSKVYFIPILIVSNLTMMYFMDLDGEAYKLAYPIGGVCGLISCLVMYRARARWMPPVMRVTLSGRMRKVGPNDPEAKEGRFAGTVKLFKRDRNFAIYELGFMLYGHGFMIMMAAIPVFYKEQFHIEYQEFALYTMVVFQGAILASHMVLRGRTGQWSATRVAGSAFTILAFVPGVLLATAMTGISNLSIAAFVIFGVGMAMLEYAWNFGPIRFAQNGDPKPYVTAHVTLVGVRGMTAYPIALWLLGFAQNGSYNVVLAVPAAFFLSAAMTNLWLSRRLKAAGIKA